MCAASVADEGVEEREAASEEDEVEHAHDDEIAADLFGARARENLAGGADGVAPTAARIVGLSSGKSTEASTRSRALVRTVIAPNKVPLAAMPGVATRATSARPGPKAMRSRLKKSAEAGTTTASIAKRNASTPRALPAKMALRARGETSSPVRADSSRSRCQVRLSESTAAKLTLTQMTAGATGDLVLPKVKATDAMTAMSSAKKPAVTTISRVFASMLRSFERTSQVWRGQEGVRIAGLGNRRGGRVGAPFSGAVDRRGKIDRAPFRGPVKRRRKVDRAPFRGPVKRRGGGTGRLFWPRRSARGRAVGHERRRTNGGPARREAWLPA